MKAQIQEEFFGGFKWAVPRAFASPLSACRFEQGDVLYDTDKAYEGEWGAAKSHIKHSVEIKAPMRGGGVKSDEDQDSAFADNWNSRVEFVLNDHRAEKERHVVTTQGRLYWLLWKGKVEEFETADVKVPAAARALMEHLSATVEPIRARLAKADCAGGIFVTPYDAAEQRLWAKARAIEEALRDFGVTHGVEKLIEAGVPDPDAYAPTARVAWFALREPKNFTEVEAALKLRLHKPSKNKKTDKEVFKADRHGHYAA
jgi:hypothetical protein